MGRLVVCNEKNIFEKLSLSNIKAGFKKSGSFEGRNINVETYSKLNITTQNYYQDGDDFVACAGTLIYKDKMGVECLRDLYNDFSEDINKIRKNAAGMYVVAIKKGDGLYIFVDEVGTYAYHYLFKDGVFISTNTYYHIAKITQPGVDRLAFKERVLKFCNIDSATIFDDIYRLLGHQAVQINLATNKINIIEIGQNTYEFTIGTDNDAAKTFVELIGKYMKKYPVHNDGVLFSTGGVDSNVLLFRGETYYC